MQIIQLAESQKTQQFLKEKLEVPVTVKDSRVTVRLQLRLRNVYFVLLLLFIAVIILLLSRWLRLKLRRFQQRRVEQVSYNNVNWEELLYIFESNDFNNNHFFFHVQFVCI